MKIVEKVILEPNDNHILFSFTNNTNNLITIPLIFAHEITGKIKTWARITKEEDPDEFNEYKYTRILYEPYFLINTDGSLHCSPERTDPEYDLRSLPLEKQDNPSPEDIEYLNSPVNIPPGVKSLSIMIDEGDRASIWAICRTTHIIIDDDGNEIPLETFLEERDAKLKSDMQKTIEKKITEMMLEKNRENI